MAHDWFALIASCDLTQEAFGATPASVEEFWSNIHPKDPRLFENQIKDVPDWKKLFVVFEFHGDAAPHQKHDSLITTSFRSLLSTASVDLAMLLLACAPGVYA